MVTRRKGEKVVKKDDNEKGAFRVRQRESSFEGSKDVQSEESRLRSPAYVPVSDSERYGIIFWIAVGISQFVGVTCIALVVNWCLTYGGFAWSSDANLQFFVHPLLMVLGLIFCYGDAILVYRVLYFLPKWILKWIHAFLHLSAIVLSSVGLLAVFENHRRTDKADMYSLHSWVGITTFGFFCLQYVGSFIAFLYPGLSSSVRANMMPFHTFFGVAIFILAVATAEMGLTERLLWTTKGNASYTRGDYIEAGALGNALGLFLIVFAFLVVFIATHSTYKRRPRPLDMGQPTS